MHAILACTQPHAAAGHGIVTLLAQLAPCKACNAQVSGSGAPPSTSARWLSRSAPARISLALADCLLTSTTRGLRGGGGGKDATRLGTMRAVKGTMRAVKLPDWPWGVAREQCRQMEQRRMVAFTRPSHVGGCHGRLAQAHHLRAHAIPVLQGRRVCQENTEAQQGCRCAVKSDLARLPCPKMQLNTAVTVLRQRPTSREAVPHTVQQPPLCRSAHLYVEHGGGSVDPQSRNLHGAADHAAWVVAQVQDEGLGAIALQQGRKEEGRGRLSRQRAARLGGGAWDAQEQVLLGGKARPRLICLSEQPQSERCAPGVWPFAATHIPLIRCPMGRGRTLSW